MTTSDKSGASETLPVGFGRRPLVAHLTCLKTTTADILYDHLSLFFTLLVNLYNSIYLALLVVSRAAGLMGYDVVFVPILDLWPL